MRKRARRSQVGGTGLLTPANHVGTERQNVVVRGQSAVIVWISRYNATMPTESEIGLRSTLPDYPCQ